jgi:hypothetical protein
VPGKGTERSGAEQTEKQKLTENRKQLNIKYKESGRPKPSGIFLYTISR